MQPGHLIEPCRRPEAGGRDIAAFYVYLTPDLDEALWTAELSDGKGRGRVYVVKPIGPIEDVRQLTVRKVPNHPSMSYRSREPLRVVDAVTAWTLYHGTRADLQPGDLIEPGYASNYGERKKAAYVYLTATLDAAAWGAELAVGDGVRQNLSYGPDVGYTFRQVSTYVARILKGASPADLPFEQSTKLRLVVNLRTARALDVAIPHSVLFRADELLRD